MITFVLNLKPSNGRTDGIEAAAAKIENQNQHLCTSHVQKSSIKHVKTCFRKDFVSG
jgi:hypothetical protein